MELVISTVVKAPMGVVFSVLRDVKKYPKLFRYMKDVKVLSSSDDQVVAQVLEDVFGFHYWVKVRFRFQPNKGMEVRQLSGPLKFAFAWFTLEEVEGGTKLTHGAEIHTTGLAAVIGQMVLSSGEAKRRMVRELMAVKREAEGKAAS